MILQVSCFLYFPDGNLPRCWIFKSIKLYMLTRLGGSRHITMPNIVNICQLVAKILRFFNFFKWRPLPSWIVEFAKCYWLVSGGPKTHHSTKFRQNQSFRCGDIAIFRVSNMVAARHLWFAWGTFGPPTVSTLGSLSSAKFWYDRCRSFFL